MRRHLPVRAINYLKTHLQKKKWRRVVTALSCIVVFCTTYALILPAVTMSQQPFCGKEEHIHDPESCYARVLVCGQDAPDEDTPEQPEHVHTDACYQEEAILVCELAEGEGDEFRYLAGMITSVSTLSPYLCTVPCAFIVYLLYLYRNLLNHASLTFWVL